MKITDIESQKDKDRVNIYIDHKFAFGLTYEISYKYGLEIHKEIDSDFIENVLKAEEQNKITNSALNLISYRQRSVKEISDSLKNKGYEEVYIVKAIEFCKAQNYLNDEYFAQCFIKDKQNLNKLGSKRIRYELLSKGISNEIIEKTLQIEPDDEYEIALEMALKKFKSYNGQDRNSQYRKLGGFLQRKGYPYEVVTKVLNHVLDGE